jgi:hypothetical protein
MPIGSPSRPKQGLIILATVLLAILVALPSMAQEEYVTSKDGKTSLNVRTLNKAEPILIFRTNFREFENDKLYVFDGMMDVIEIPLKGKRVVVYDLNGNPAGSGTLKYGDTISVQEKSDSFVLTMRKGKGNE